MGAGNAGTQAGITTSAIISIVLGIVILIVARGLLNGSAVSRGLVTVVMIIAALALASLQLVRYRRGENA